MLSVKRIVFVSLTVCVVLPLAACSNSLGETLRRSLAADPRLQSSPASTSVPVALPADFPSDIPQYPNASLVAVTPPETPTGVTQTRWKTADDGDRVRQFYQDSFQSGWKLEPSTQSNAPSRAEPLIAERNEIRVKMAIVPPDASSDGTGSNSTDANGTEFTLAYEPAQSIASSPNAAPQAGDPNFVGPIQPSISPSTSPSPQPATAAPTAEEADNALQFTDLAQAPEELRSNLEDLAKLGVLSLSATGTNSPTAFKPNQIVTRREFARWLVAANNRIYGDRPAQKIRPGSATAQPAFADVPHSDPDFAAIQGLAEAGLLPSSLSGSATTTSFRPNAPLTRETLILWKTPVDLRQTLPTASISAVQQTWGFQDAARIDPIALKAVLADYQNGDLSNIRRAFGYTTLFQPKKTVTRAEAAAVLWFFGAQGEGTSAKDVLQLHP